MSELRWDPLKLHWVIIATDRGRRPRDFLVEKENKVVTRGEDIVFKWKMATDSFSNFCYFNIFIRIKIVHNSSDRHFENQIFAVRSVAELTFSLAAVFCIKLLFETELIQPAKVRHSLDINASALSSASGGFS